MADEMNKENFSHILEIRPFSNNPMCSDLQIVSVLLLEMQSHNPISPAIQSTKRPLNT